MAKKQLLAKLLGNRLSRVLSRKKGSSKSHRDSTVFLRSDYYSDSEWDCHAHIQTETIIEARDSTQIEQLLPEILEQDYYQEDHDYDSYTYVQPESVCSSQPVTIISPSFTSSQRSPRRPSFRRRFWSSSSSNHFHELDDSVSVAASSPRGIYVPRHAASDFTKTSNNRRRTVSVNLSIRRSPNDRLGSGSYPSSDDATLCSINLKDEPDPEETVRDLDMWLSTLHRQQALQALSTPAEAEISGPPLSPLHVSPHNRQSQTYDYTSWIPIESDGGSEDEFTSHTRNQANQRRRSRCSAILWAELDRTAISRPAPEPVIHRHSTYMELQTPHPSSRSSRPLSFISSGTSIAEWAQSQRPLSMGRRMSEKRRPSYTRSPGIMTVAEVV